MSTVMTDRMPARTLRYADLKPGDRFRFAYSDTATLSIDLFVKSDDGRFRSTDSVIGVTGPWRSMTAIDAPRTDLVVLA